MGRNAGEEFFSLHCETCQQFHWIRPTLTTWSLFYLFSSPDKLLAWEKIKGHMPALYRVLCDSEITTELRDLIALIVELTFGLHHEHPPHPDSVYDPAESSDLVFSERFPPLRGAGTYAKDMENLKATERKEAKNNAEFSRGKIASLFINWAIMHGACEQ